MVSMKNLFYFIFVHLVITTPQLNLYYTDWISQSQNENDNVLQHNCLRVPIDCDRPKRFCTIISYCMNELPSKFLIENNDHHLSQLTFSQLAQQNITSYQLYLWSTPIDIVERYQSYLNESSSLENETFYNCTMPKFGPMCQYQLYGHELYHRSIKDIFTITHAQNRYHPTTLTCYIHMKCNRGPSSSCLDWSEICDEKIDCLNGGVDEEHCWLLEINECKHDEYRCSNGHCISQSFLDKYSQLHYCIDRSEPRYLEYITVGWCTTLNDIELACDDLMCRNNIITSSCVKERSNVLDQTMYSNNENSSESEDCWSAFQQMFAIQKLNYLSNEELYQLNRSIKIVMDTCSHLFFYPNSPILFGDIYFAYAKNNSPNSNAFAVEKFYLCHNNSHYDSYFINTSKIFFNNMTCVNFKQYPSGAFQSGSSKKFFYSEGLSVAYHTLWKYHLSFNYNSTICNRSNMYQCIDSSKCISIYRLMDARYDCPYMDDENITLISNVISIEQINKYYYKCLTTNKYISRALIQDGNCNCGKNEYRFCEDEEPDGIYMQRNIIFQHICDGFVELLPILIENRNETDETECQQWECDNIYTRCNNLWDCPNGIDETGCQSYSKMNCSLNYHYCVLFSTNELSCLAVEKANDGHVDCLGATDESSLCHSNIPASGYISSFIFSCMNSFVHSCIESTSLCNGFEECDNGDDEQFCTTNLTVWDNLDICHDRFYSYRSDVEQFLCGKRIYVQRWAIIHFQLDGMNEFDENQLKTMENTDISKASITPISDQYQLHCHRGLDLLVWSNHTSTSSQFTCLCPPVYYGDQCQYQNQRISLIIKFQALSDSWQTLFAIVISLIDDNDQRIVHSYEQITYLWLKNCKTEYSIYLIYSSRPKDLRTNYSIHIDIYEKNDLKYRGSLLLPVKFLFLPVHRLAYSVSIPRSDEKRSNCLINPCIHGECIKYSNNPENTTFCRCYPGWSGRYCTIERTHNCASESRNIGFLANNQSICVCPLHRFGPRCLLTDPICLTHDKNSTCQNGGTCMPLHDFMIPRQDLTCICPEGYSGERCEIADNRIILSFSKDIILPQSIFIHFFQITGSKVPENTTTFKTIPIQHDSITIFWTPEFHLVFIEFPINDYYLAVKQITYHRSAIIERRIDPSDYCPSITKLFNQTFLKFQPIRLIKYYHLLCQNQ